MGIEPEPKFTEAEAQRMNKGGNRPSSRPDVWYPVTDIRLSISVALQCARMIEGWKRASVASLSMMGFECTLSTCFGEFLNGFIAMLHKKERGIIC